MQDYFKGSITDLHEQCYGQTNAFRATAPLLTGPSSASEASSGVKRIFRYRDHLAIAGSTPAAGLTIIAIAAGKDNQWTAFVDVERLKHFAST